MKKFITLIILFGTTFTLFAQVPQAICYQAVATDTRGNELVSQPIKVRLSILKTSAAGSEEWIETHSVTTDGFGLFDLTIGTGSRVGGAQTSFKDIKWGADKYFLKVEMDITGGTNYVLMGTNPMVSVPYALYSEKAGTAVTADSAKYAVKAGIADSATRAGRAYYANYADSSRIAVTAITAITALNSTRTDTSKFSMTSNFSTTSLTARRADTATFAWLADSARHANTAINAINAQNAVNAQNAINALTARRSDTASFAWLADSARHANTAVNAQNAVNAQTARRSDTATFAWLADSARRAMFATRAAVADSASRAALAYTANFATNAGAAQTALDDRDRDPLNEIQTLSFDTTTNILKLSKPAGQFDQVNFNNLALRGAGASIDFPYGVLGQAVLVTSSFTVPTGKTLFISAVNNPIDLADGRTLQIEPGMPVIPSGTAVQNCFCSGILVDNQAYATPLIIDFTDPNTEYFVPMGSSLIVKSGASGSRNMSFVIDGTNFDFFTGSSSSPRLIVIPEGRRIRKGLTNVGKFVVTGYLLKK